MSSASHGENVTPHFWAVPAAGLAASQDRPPAQSVPAGPGPKADGQNSPADPPQA